MDCHVGNFLLAAVLRPSWLLLLEGNEVPARQSVVWQEQV